MSGRAATTRRHRPTSAPRAPTRSRSSRRRPAPCSASWSERAYSTVHEGAIYLHLGESFLVRELDLRARAAVVTPYTGDYYTQAKKETATAIDEPLRSEQRCGLELTFGRISVTEQVVAYQKKSTRDQATLETVPLDLPETSFETEAIWYLPTDEQLAGLERMPKLLS